jgi:Zn-dependent peptidase ImmA (M78 family)/transcriptional regulator with XRE-family HTH domain
LDMANYAEGVNPDVLRWARERAGYSLEDIAHAFRKDVEEISSWEQGKATPTYSQLERLAYTLYKRPIALFFFPSPPDEPTPKESFRTLPDFEINSLQPDTHHAIREAQAMQIALRELTDGQNPSERQIFKELAISFEANVADTARRVREYLGVTVLDQSEWRNTTVALKNWRQLVQDVGIFIFKRSIKQRDISGFCLVDDEFPIIYLNNSVAKTRQIFTIFHELAHILAKSAGITKLNDRYISSLSGHERAIEVFCNAFAAEFLVPSSDFERRWDPTQPVDTLTDSLADYYKVSREVILRKILDRGLVDQTYYEAKVAEWLEEGRLSGAGGRGNYYATQAAYLGDKYLNLAFIRYYEGRISLQQLAEYLNIKAINVPDMERRMLSGVSSQ